MKRIFSETRTRAICAAIPPILFFAAATMAAADSDGATPKVPATRNVFSVVDDNDFFGGWSDKYYTNHTRLAFTLGADGGQTVRESWFFSLGQEMYAPKDREARVPDERDHPYAGYLYASVGKAVFSDDFAISPEIQIGVTGKHSYAKNIQRGYHELIDEVKPAGWDTQIHERFVVQANGDVRKRFALLGDAGNGALGSDIIVRGFGGIGNLRGILSTGAELRVGINLPKDFGATGLRHSSSVVFDPQVDFSLHGFFDLQADAILWDKTLTGNNDSGADIYAYPFAAQASIGIRAVYDCYMLTIFQTFRTKDFSSQDKDFFAFGGFKFSILF